MIDEILRNEAASQPYPLLFATVSGAHLYGFPSPDSDYDLRGVHILPADEVLGLGELRETIDISKVENGIEFDLVTHDARKFFELMLRRNGYVLEQLYSPLVVLGGPAHEELKAIGASCITRHHVHHYLGFAQTQWNLFLKENPQKVKPLLYVYRVLLTGIHLMNTGVVEANLRTLNEEFRLSYLDDLIERKTTQTERTTLNDADLEFHQREFSRLESMLKQAHERTALPDQATARPALSDLLIRLRNNR